MPPKRKREVDGEEERRDPRPGERVSEVEGDKTIRRLPA